MYDPPFLLVPASAKEFTHYRNIAAPSNPSEMYTYLAQPKVCRTILPALFCSCGCYLLYVKEDDPAGKPFKDDWTQRIDGMDDLV